MIPDCYRYRFVSPNGQHSEWSYVEGRKGLDLLTNVEIEPMYSESTLVSEGLIK
jgi:hypothetical protein